MHSKYIIVESLHNLMYSHFIFGSNSITISHWDLSNGYLIASRFMDEASSQLRFVFQIIKWKRWRDNRSLEGSFRCYILERAKCVI